MRAGRSSKATTSRLYALVPHSLLSRSHSPTMLSAVPMHRSNQYSDLDISGGTTTLVAISSAPSTMLARALTRALAYIFKQTRLHQLHHNRKYPLQLLRPLLRRRRQLPQPIRRHHHDLTFQSTPHDEDSHRLQLRRPGGKLHRAHKRHLRLPAPEHPYRRPQTS